MLTERVHARLQAPKTARGALEVRKNLKLFTLQGGGRYLTERLAAGDLALVPLATGSGQSFGDRFGPADDVCKEPVELGYQVEPA